MSVRARLVPLYLRVVHAQRRWRSTEALFDAVAARPDAAPAPHRIGRAVRPQRQDRGGLVVVDVVAAGADGPPVVYLHGGGYVFDPVPEHWRFAAALSAGSERPVHVVRYPLAPVGVAAEVVPRVAALAAVLAASDTGHGSVALAGDSAGAGLALAAAQLLRDEHGVAADLALSSPWLDVRLPGPEVQRIALRDPWLAPAGLRAAGELWRGRLAADHPFVSPIHGDLAGLGRIAVVNGTRDVLAPDSRRLARLGRAAGADVRHLEAPGLLHNWALMPIPEARAGRRVLLGALDRRP